MLRAAALRFWLSRLYDLHQPRAAEMLTPHDPTHFERILRERIATPHRACPHCHYMNKLPATTGWPWLKQGSALFRKQPAALTTLLFANILFSILISAVPLLGAMVAVVLIPSFSMAFMKAAR